MPNNSVINDLNRIVHAVEMLEAENRSLQARLLERNAEVEKLLSGGKLIPSGYRLVEDRPVVFMDDDIARDFLPHDRSCSGDCRVTTSGGGSYNTPLYAAIEVKVNAALAS